MEITSFTDMTFEQFLVCIEDAKKGDKLSLFHLAEFCFYDLEDYKQAFKFHEKALNKGLSESGMVLGGMCWTGKGVEKDMNKSLEYYNKAAELGNTIAYEKMSYIYERGLGVAKDLNLALRYLNEAYCRGMRTVKNKIEALKHEIETEEVKKILYSESNYCSSTCNQTKRKYRRILFCMKAGEFPEEAEDRVAEEYLSAMKLVKRVEEIKAKAEAGDTEARFFVRKFLTEK